MPMTKLKALEWIAEVRKVSELKEIDDNPRKITEDAFNLLKKRIIERGFHDVVKVDTEDFILSGNQRKRALNDLKLTQVNTLKPNRPLTKEERDAVVIESNRSDGEFDWDMMANQFDEQQLRDLGFSDLELGLMTFDDDRDETEDDIPETPAEPITVLGDLYELGAHRVLCGDSTKKEDVAKLMNGRKANMVFTDPPYNVDYSGSNSKGWDPIKNDKMTKEQFDTFLHEVFQRYAEVSEDDAGWYVFHSSTTQDQFKAEIEKANWKVKTQIIWNKPAATMGWSDYRMKHEPMYYCGKENVKFYGDRTGTSVWDFHANEDDLLKFVKQLMRADRDGRNTIWTMKREPVADYVHPTQKPVELICHAIRNSSKNEDLVVDLFLGSGATMIAAGKKGRVCYGMELDPKFVDVIVSRYCNYVQNWDIIKNGEKITWPHEEKETRKKK